MGDSLLVSFLPGCTNLAMGRNQIVKEFLGSDSDKLVFVDADVTFEAGKLVKLAHYPFDVVGGVYRYKNPDEEKYPLGFLDEDTLRANEFGLLEVAMLPTGFLCLSKEAFARFRKHYPDREYESRGQTSFAYFQIPYKDGALYTEDGFFCREWKEAGEKIFLDPEIELTHWDYNIPYVGHIGKWLRSKITEEQKTKYLETKDTKQGEANV